MLIFGCFLNGMHCMAHGGTGQTSKERSWIPNQINPDLRNIFYCCHTISGYDKEKEMEGMKRPFPGKQSKYLLAIDKQQWAKQW